MALSAAERQRRYRQRHPERVKAASKRYYAENRENERRRNKAWIEANREARTRQQAEWMRSSAGKASQARYHAKNREARLAANARWRARNRDRRRVYLRAYWHIKRARKQGAAGTCSPEQWCARVDYYGGNCWMCGAEATTVDHVIPLCRGGTNWPANLRPACVSCNSAKGARSWRLYTKREVA